jgi:hypothetical protein
MAVEEKLFKDKGWVNKISNHAQCGGIETAVADNGAGRGTRFAWVNTGAGLRYKIVIDRGMDIVDAFFNNHSLAWISHGGITAPQPFSDKGIDWLRTFAGGLLTTCGLSHAGGPESDDTGTRGLHGLISNTPAEVISIVQPDPASGDYGMRISGLMRESMVLGSRLELKRTISGTLGKASITVEDEVTNRGNLSAPHMMLYHLNFGWPLVDEGTDLFWEGQWVSREGESAKIFRDGVNFKKCLPPLEEHNGFGEEAVFIDAAESADGMVHCGLINASLGFAVGIKYKKSDFPCLTNWQHWGNFEYVTGLEPATNFPVGQARARKENSLIFLAPGETRKTKLELFILTDKDEISAFAGSSI